MTEVKLLAEERMLNDHNRALRSIDVVVERTLVGRPMDRINLLTALNCIAATDGDTPPQRAANEQLLRRGHPLLTTLAEYRVAASQVIPDWSPTPKSETP